MARVWQEFNPTDMLTPQQAMLLDQGITGQWIDKPDLPVTVAAPYNNTSRPSQFYAPPAQVATEGEALLRGELDARPVTRRRISRVPQSQIRQNLPRTAGELRKQQQTMPRVNGKATTLIYPTPDGKVTVDTTTGFGKDENGNPIIVDPQTNKILNPEQEALLDKYGLRVNYNPYAVPSMQKLPLEAAFERTRQIPVTAQSVQTPVQEQAVSTEGMTPIVDASPFGGVKPVSYIPDPSLLGGPTTSTSIDEGLTTAPSTVEALPSQQEKSVTPSIQQSEPIAYQEVYDPGLDSNVTYPAQQPLGTGYDTLSDPDSALNLAFPSAYDSDEAKTLRQLKSKMTPEEWAKFEDQRAAIANLGFDLATMALPLGAVAKATKVFKPLYKLYRRTNFGKLQTKAFRQTQKQFQQTAKELAQVDKQIKQLQQAVPRGIRSQRRWEKMAKDPKLAQMINKDAEQITRFNSATQKPSLGSQVENLITDKNVPVKFGDRGPVPSLKDFQQAASRMTSKIGRARAEQNLKMLQNYNKVLKARQDALQSNLNWSLENIWRTLM